MDVLHFHLVWLVSLGLLSFVIVVFTSHKDIEIGVMATIFIQVNSIVFALESIVDPIRKAIEALLVAGGEAETVHWVASNEHRICTSL